jgi:hypothetical protein
VDSEPPPGDDTEPLADTEQDPPPDRVPGITPLFQPERGLYDAPFTLAVSTEIDGARVRFTLDGQDPRGPESLEWTEDLLVDATTTVRAVVEQDGSFLGAPFTHTYLFPAQVTSRATPESYPTRWWTWYTSGGYTADYGMDPEIYEDPAYTDAFPGVFSALPSLLLSMDPLDLFGPRGIYENPTSEGSDWERPVSMEWLPSDGSPGFQVNAGLRVHGGASRDPACSAKKSFRVTFRSEYGEPSLRAPLFPAPGPTRVENLILRAGYNLSWIHWSSSQRSMATYRRDNLARALQASLGDPSTRDRFAHLYLDGLYWGLYSVHERPDAAFLAELLGGTEDDWDVIHTGEVLDGDREAWDAMMAVVGAGLSNASAWEALRGWLDVQNFANYYLLNLYLGNDDWPHNNWVAARRREEGAGFIFFSWDAEHIVKDVDTNRVDVDAADSPGRIFQRLRQNESFRALFSDTARRLLAEDGPLGVPAVTALWDELGRTLDGVVVAESARWGDNRRDVNPYSEGPYELYTVNGHYLPEDRRVRDEWLPRRTAIVIAQLRAAGLYQD